MWALIARKTHTFYQLCRKNLEISLHRYIERCCSENRSVLHSNILSWDCRTLYTSKPCVQLKTKTVFYYYHAACSRMLNNLCENKLYLLLSKLENVFLAEIADYHLFVWMRPWHASHFRWTWFVIQFIYSISCQMNDNYWIKYWYK